MVRQNLKKYISNVLVFTWMCVLLQSSCRTPQNMCLIYTGYDYDSTYFIVNTLSKRVIYEGGHNKILNDTIIGDNHIFIEDLYTEECSHRIIIYNPVTNTLSRAFNLNWGDLLNDEDWDKLVTGVNKEYTIEALDNDKKNIVIRFFNDSTRVLDLERYNE